MHWYGAIEGLLKWTVTSGDGRSVTLGGLSAGSWFGEGTLLRGTPRTADVIALRPSRVALVPMETFERLHATQRSFDHFLLRQINERMHWFLGNFTAHHLLDTDSQVARALAACSTPGCTRAATRTCRCRRKKLPTCRACHASAATRR